jgi:hypothetical protein
VNGQLPPPDKYASFCAKMGKWFFLYLWSYHNFSYKFSIIFTQISTWNFHDFSIYWFHDLHISWNV